MKNKLTAPVGNVSLVPVLPWANLIPDPSADPNKVDAKSSVTHQMPMPANLGFTPLVNAEEQATSIF